MITYQEAKAFVKAYEKKFNHDLAVNQAKVNRRKRRLRFRGGLRVYHPPEKVSHRLHKRRDAIGHFVYTVSVDGEDTGRVVIGAKPNGKPGIIMSYHITRKDLHKDLNLTEKIKTTKAENRWRGAHS